VQVLVRGGESRDDVCYATGIGKAWRNDDGVGMDVTLGTAYHGEHAVTANSPVCFPNWIKQASQ
jgi:hypothetical protein